MKRSRPEPSANGVVLVTSRQAHQAFGRDPASRHRLLEKTFGGAGRSRSGGAMEPVGSRAGSGWAAGEEAPPRGAYEEPDEPARALRDRGTGARAAMFVDAMVGAHREAAELVGLCD